MIQHHHQIQLSIYLQPIQDPDPLSKCDFLDDRDTFASFLREHFYQFSSKRHAQYSTLCILYDLHNKDVVVYTCDNCKKSIETRYHCTECDVSTLHGEN